VGTSTSASTFATNMPGRRGAWTCGITHPRVSTRRSTGPNMRDSKRTRGTQREKSSWGSGSTSSNGSARAPRRGRPGVEVQLSRDHDKPWRWDHCGAGRSLRQTALVLEPVTTNTARATRFLHAPLVHSYDKKIAQNRLLETAREQLETERRMRATTHPAMEALVATGEAEVVGAGDSSSLKDHRGSMVRLVVARKTHSRKKAPGTESSAPTLATADAPPTRIDRSLGTPSLFAPVINDKFDRGSAEHRNQVETRSPVFTRRRPAPLSGSLGSSH
jgi:hypothetical protein